MSSKKNTLSKTIYNRENKAQTSIDLLLGISIFFAVIGLLIGHNAAIFAPSGVAASDTKMVSDRIANELIEKEFANDGGTVTDSDKTSQFLNDASDNEEFLEERFLLENERGIKIEISINTTGDDRKLPPMIDSDNTDLNYIDSISYSENRSVISIESMNFDGSGSSSTRYTTIDDRTFKITVSVGRPL